MKVTDWDTNRVDLTWLPPAHDGGSPVTNYVIECKERFKSEWVKCHETEDDKCQGSVTEVIQEGKTYEFRVRAVNRAGPGEPSQPSGQVTCKARFVKPFIIGEEMMDKVVKCGQSLSWDIKFGGEPKPKVQWYKDDQLLEPDHR